MEGKKTKVNENASSNTAAHVPAGYNSIDQSIGHVFDRFSSAGIVREKVSIAIASGRGTSVAQEAVVQLLEEPAYAAILEPGQLGGDIGDIVRRVAEVPKELLSLSWELMFGCLWRTRLGRRA